MAGAGPDVGARGVAASRLLLADDYRAGSLGSWGKRRHRNARVFPASAACDRG